MLGHLASPKVLRFVLISYLALLSAQADAGGPFRRRERVVVPTVRAVNPAPLGTFTPTPYTTIRGNFPNGGGYSPNFSYGSAVSMDIYGPLSVYRGYTAPVLNYTRGYDGRSAIVEGTSFSTPNLPPSTPVVYPTQATYFYGFRETTNPPWWPKGLNWIDQN